MLSLFEELLETDKLALEVEFPITNKNMMNKIEGRMGRSKGQTWP